MKTDLEKVEKAIKKSWCLDTCHPEDRNMWPKKYPSYGHCGITALLIQEIYGGDLACNKKLNHVWNILKDGKEYDLCRDNYLINKEVKAEKYINRYYMLNDKEAKKFKRKQRYNLLKRLVLKELNLKDFNKM